MALSMESFVFVVGQSKPTVLVSTMITLLEALASQDNNRKED